jgi:hypothetical protein
MVYVYRGFSWLLTILYYSLINSKDEELKSKLGQNKNVG